MQHPTENARRLNPTTAVERRRRPNRRVQPPSPAALPCLLAALGLLNYLFCPLYANEQAVNLRLTLRDANTGQLVPGRITVEQHPAGAASVHHFVQTLAPQGSAIPYEVRRSPQSFEAHTTVSAHPCGAVVPPGYYVIRYEHGPEWRGNKAQATVEPGKVTEVELPTSRWIDMNARGWYSGDTHVHRSLAELPNVMRAEDLNVALPLSYWVRQAHQPPVLEEETKPVEPKLITVDPDRVIWPLNTEYEIFSVDGKRHTLGAVFVLNHQRPLTLAAPPVEPIAAEARRQGALLDLDKHSWPWSMMLVPVMGVDLFELANNHIWKTEFFYKQWTREMRPAGWNIETEAPLAPMPAARLGGRAATPPETQPERAETADAGFTEWGWIDFGFKTYYALLNSGFKLRPTAGTASGVHPVPLGYGRVYVECPDGFSYDRWMSGLQAGRSFVTTGPMLLAQVNDQPAGGKISVPGPTTVRVHGSVESIHGNNKVEIVKNGRLVDVLDLDWKYESPWIWRASFDVDVPVDASSWIAVRVFEAHQSQPPWKTGFAHSSPVHIEMPGRPLRPRKVETDYFIARLEHEIARNRQVLTADELAEYERALQIYRQIGAVAVDDFATTDRQLEMLVLEDSEFPAGWMFADTAESELPLRGNPCIFSHPLYVNAVASAVSATRLENAAILRCLVARYSRAQQEFAALHTAIVCADEAEASRIARLIENTAHVRQHGHVERRRDVVLCVLHGPTTPEEERVAFLKATRRRLAQSLGDGPRDDSRPSE